MPKAIVNKASATHHEPDILDFNPLLPQFSAAWLKIHLDKTPQVRSAEHTQDAPTHPRCCTWADTRQQSCLSSCHIVMHVRAFVSQGEIMAILKDKRDNKYAYVTKHEC